MRAKIILFHLSTPLDYSSPPAAAAAAVRGIMFVQC
jgi:hypothetical protein